MEVDFDTMTNRNLVTDVSEWERYGVSMYGVSIILFVLLVLGVSFFSGGVTFFLDFPSILLVLLLTGSMLMASGLWKDLIRAFRVIAKRQTQISIPDLHCSLEAVELTMKMLVFSGVFGSLIGSIALLSQANPQNLRQNFSIVLLTTLYALFLMMILMPVRSYLKSLIFRSEKTEK